MTPQIEAQWAESQLPPLKAAQRAGSRSSADAATGTNGSGGNGSAGSQAGSTGSSAADGAAASAAGGEAAGAAGNGTMQPNGSLQAEFVSGSGAAGRAVAAQNGSSSSSSRRHEAAAAPMSGSMQVENPAMIRCIRICIYEECGVGKLDHAI